MLVRLSLAFVLMDVCALVAGAQEKSEPSPTARGQKQLDAYFLAQVKDIESHCLANLTTHAEWERQRPELRRQFFDMMGLWPLPAKTDLKATITGKVEGDGFTVEKLHFQSMPGLYVTANLYLPMSSPDRKVGGATRYPTILYVCGHGNVVENGISYGSKVSYHYHPAWFASHGYACLILDTNELGEIRGDHHGTYSRGMWWWQARGYTPAGVELWNAIRALDYLETRPEVDAKRIGLTGRSGGGATSWWVAAADDRVQAIVPVAGIADLHAHVCAGAAPQFMSGVISGHCDCMFPVNTYRWDFAQVAALCAPRPLLLGNSDDDAIFPVAGYRRLAEKVRKVYALYGADEKFQLLETKGPHKDTPELHQGINRWMNRWLKDDAKSPIDDDLKRVFAPPQLKVFETLPNDRINEKIHETFVPMASHPLPANASLEWWTKRRAELLSALRQHVFAGWPETAPALQARVESDIIHDGIRLRALDFVSEHAIELRMWIITAPKVERPEEVILSVLDEPAWVKWCEDLGPEFASVLQLNAKPKRNETMFAQNRAAMEQRKLAFAAIAPRGVGPTRWAEPGSKDDVQIRRRFPLMGQTLDGQRVWDVRRAVSAFRTLPGMESVPMTLHGERDAAGIALYAAIFEPAVAGLDLWHLPTTHRNGPILLNVLKVLDVPQAVALAFQKKVVLHVKSPADRAAWDWPERVNPFAGGPRLTLRVVGE